MSYSSSNTIVCYVPFTESNIPYFMVYIILNDDEMIPVSYKWECDPKNKSKDEFSLEFNKAEEEAIKYAKKIQSKFDCFNGELNNVNGTTTL